MSIFGILLSGSAPRFSIRLTNESPQRIGAISNGFRLYSPDGAQWHDVVTSATEDFPTHIVGTPGGFGFDYGPFLREAGVTGSGADTVGFGAYSMFSNGLAGGYDEVAFIIDIGPIPEESVGKQICFDSCWYPPTNEWMWQSWYTSEPADIPTWDGPHCFTVAACCEYRGDATLDGGINVSDPDLSRGVSLPGRAGPGCFEAGDVNGDTTGPNVSDLTYLVAFLFQGGPEPPGC